MYSIRMMKENPKGFSSSFSMDIILNKIRGGYCYCQKDVNNIRGRSYTLNHTKKNYDQSHS